MKIVNRRGVVTTLAAACFCRGVHAQDYVGTFMCNYGGQPSIEDRYNPERWATNDVRNIMRAIGFYNTRISVYATDSGGLASATILADRSGNPQNAIIYNSVGMERLYDDAGPWAPRSVLAHEVGHHANLDTLWVGQMNHPWRRELGADWVSGYALARMGAPLNEAGGAQIAMFEVLGSPSHPDSYNRLLAITQGWYAGGGAGNPFR